MAIIGHAIMGDIAYEPKSVKKNSGSVYNEATMERITSDRMCLHAHKLSLPLDDSGKRETFIAPDPFTKLN